MGSKGWTWELRREGGRKGRGYTGKGGTYWSVRVSAHGADLNGGGGAWHGVPSNQWTSKFFLMESALPGLELKSSFAAVDEGDSDDEIPSVSVEDVPAVSTETVLEHRVGRGQPLFMKWNNM